MLRAAEMRDDRAWRRTAQLAAWLLAPWSKRRMTPDKLLRKRPYVPPLIPGDIERRLLDDARARDEDARAAELVGVDEE